MLYILLELKVIRMNWISDGAEFLLATMVFFFIPSVVGIMDVVSDITKSYIIFFLLIIVGTSCVALALVTSLKRWLNNLTLREVINSMTFIQAILMILLTVVMYFAAKSYNKNMIIPFEPSASWFGRCHYCIIVNTSKLS